MTICCMTSAQSVHRIVDISGDHTEGLKKRLWCCDAVVLVGEHGAVDVVQVFLSAQVSRCLYQGTLQPLGDAARYAKVQIGDLHLRGPEAAGASSVPDAAITITMAVA